MFAVTVHVGATAETDGIAVDTDDGVGVGTAASVGLGAGEALADGSADVRTAELHADKSTMMSDAIAGVRMLRIVRNRDYGTAAERAFGVGLT